MRKLGKRVLALPPVIELLFATAALLERSAPESPVLDRVYRLLLGAHIFRGYRRGLARFIGPAPVSTSALTLNRG